MAIKPILQLYPVIPAASEEERAALRPIGRNVERYQEVLHGMSELVRTAERLGFWGVSTLEHHFHSEGYEVGPAPSVINAYWAAITENIHVGNIGYTMTAQNPIRVAEESAVLDHLTRGRSFVGFSRGYQRRWTNVLGQHVGSRATMSPTDRSDDVRQRFDSETLARQVDDDTRNREIFEEHIDIVLKSWTQDAYEHHSERWDIPAREGIEWEMADTTSRLGAPGEMGEDGRLHRVSVTPKPFQSPHPPVFIASSSSVETIEYAARHNFIPSYFSPAEKAAKFGRIYQDAAQSAGAGYTFGENQNLMRWIEIADTTELAHQALRDYDLEMYRNLYWPLAPFSVINEANPTQGLIDSGLYNAGTIDEVRDQFVAQWTALPAEYVTIVSHYGQQPLDVAIRNLELFAEHILPVLDEITDAARAGVSADA